MARVELIYDSDCPNIPGARKALLEGFALAGFEPFWIEWDRQSPESPPHVRQHGSPTVLVDGHDVAADSNAPLSGSCRIYDHGSEGLRGVPPASQIAVALEHMGRSNYCAGSERHGWPFSASLPAVGATLLPVGFCPACWPAYAGVLGTLGLGFLLDRAYLLPLTTVLFGVALFALGFRAQGRRGHGPFLLGTLCAALALVFKFAYPILLLSYTGLAGFITAALWNAWPVKSSASDLLLKI